jgi:exopolysaccharide biosynthesis polyprenyl glycosylphosphotransferase
MLGPVRDLQTIVRETMPDLVVVAVDRGRPEVFSALGNVAALGFRVVGLPEFYEHAFGRVPVRRMTDAWFMSILHLYQRPYSRRSKRAFDVAGALFGLLLTAPLFPLIALLVSRTEGPIFYRQTRLGEQGRLFTILKFRTMRSDAESNGAVWAQESDPRMTNVGRLLRATRLDEIPQLINVLRGEMSIVGPRPERPEFVELLEQSVPFWSRRHLLRPGITGWAQLRSGYAADSLATEEKLSYDLWYLRHQSLVVDALICARTLPSLLLAVGR